MIRRGAGVFGVTAALLAATGAHAATPEVSLDLAPASELSRLPGHHTVAEAVPGKDGVKRLVVLRGLDKLTGQAMNIDAPAGVPVHYATLTITAHWCYSTPSSETPETNAFVTIQDHRPDKPARQVFSGWMWASTPSLNAMQHPLYDVWVISCKTNLPGQDSTSPLASTAPVKAVSPNKGAKDEKVELPADAGQ